MVTKKRIKRLVTPVPRNLEEAAEFLTKIGIEKRGIEKIQTRLNDLIEGLKADAMGDVNDHNEKISQLVEGLFAFAESRRDELTEGGKRKTVDLPTGWFGWRKTPPSVSIRNVKSVITILKELGLERFVRVKEEPDKKAMLKEPEVVKLVKGVSITQHDEFVVKPTELEIEIASDIKKLKKAVS